MIYGSHAWTRLYEICRFPAEIIGKKLLMITDLIFTVPYQCFSDKQSKNEHSPSTLSCKNTKTI